MIACSTILLRSSSVNFPTVDMNSLKVLTSAEPSDPVIVSMKRVMLGVEQYLDTLTEL